MAGRPKTGEMCGTSSVVLLFGLGARIPHSALGTMQWLNSNLSSCLSSSALRARQCGQVQDWQVSRMSVYLEAWHSPLLSDTCHW